MLPLGGAFARAPDGATPLGYRGAKWDYHVLAQWAEPAETERSVEWTRDFDAAMAEYAEAGVYVNFVGDPSAGARRGRLRARELRAPGGDQAASTTRTTSSATTPTSRPAARGRVGRRSP